MRVPPGAPRRRNTGASGVLRLGRPWGTALVLLVLVTWVLVSWRFLYPPVDLSQARRALLAGMVFCPAGVLRTSTPSREYAIEAFWIDRFEVTRADYARYLAAHPDQPPPIYWAGSDQDGRVREGELPVAWVTLPQARAYARWIGKRLPTSPEWGWAARGASGRKYPWGAEAQRAVANTAELRLGVSTPVGLFEDGRNSLGLYDMVGNVWEWTTTLGGWEVADRYYVRGGSFRTALFVVGNEPTLMDTHVQDQKTLEWRPDERVLRGPDTAAGDLGFRCVLGASSVASFDAIELLGGRDPVSWIFQVRPAMEKLRAIGEPCVPYLRRALEEAEPGVVRQRLEGLIDEIRAGAGGPRD